MKLVRCDYEAGFECWAIDMPDRGGCLICWEPGAEPAHIELVDGKYRYNEWYPKCPRYVGPEFDTPEEAALYAVMNLEVK